MLGKMMDSISKPSGSMSYAQLAAATIFVITVALAWRQVVAYILREA